ncbi:MAG: hypothetical protein IKH14_04350, partial [Prevotella sp.]|nr:hypothetical protein [Prevotella sp.]
ITKHKRYKYLADADPVNKFDVSKEISTKAVLRSDDECDSYDLGEIEDEHDNKQLVAKQTDPDTYIISARLEINKINNMLNINLPEDDEYNTLAGLILHYHQNFPKINQTIQIHDFQCKVIKKTNTKIQLVELKLNQPQPPEDSNE